MLGKDNDYSYIEVFIGFMVKIIQVIQRLFHKKDVETGEDMDNKE